MNDSLTAVDGIRVGHWHDDVLATGCSVILSPPQGCVASGEARGAAPGTRELALLQPTKMVDRVHAICLSGGSAFGLDAASGVMRYLQEKDVGFVTPFARVPIVPAAVIFDLATGQVAAPQAEHGYQAAMQASSQPVANGRYGAGRGASCGKYLGFEGAQYGGLGSAALTVGDCTVAALAVVNAFGDVVDEQGQVIAGARYENGTRPDQRSIKDVFARGAEGQNTTLVVMATNATISKAQAHALAQSAHVGIAQSIRPSHTVVDGDTSFVISTCHVASPPMLTLSISVQQVVAEAVREAAREANRSS